MTVSGTRSILVAGSDPAPTALSAPLPRSFYARPTIVVARDLLGKILVFDAPTGRYAARLVEVEAYHAERDPASHAFRGPTARNAPMFGESGTSYVYFIYGMYFCLNVVARGTSARAGAVLLRGAEPIAGFTDEPHLLAGPGKICRAFGLTTAHSGLDLTTSALRIHDAPPVPSGRVARARRVGLGAVTTTGRPWRYLVRGSPGVSRGPLP